MTRGGRAQDRDEPERRCLATGESQPRGGLIRFVLGPDGVLVPDVAGKLPGRGMWGGAGRAGVQVAGKKKLFTPAPRPPA